MPNYLRTKLPLELEARQARRVEEAQATGQSPKEEIALHNSIISSCLKIVSDAHDDIEDQKSRSGGICILSSLKFSSFLSLLPSCVTFPPQLPPLRCISVDYVRRDAAAGGCLPHWLWTTSSLLRTPSSAHGQCEGWQAAAQLGGQDAECSESGGKGGDGVCVCTIQHIEEENAVAPFHVLYTMCTAVPHTHSISHSFGFTGPYSQPPCTPHYLSHHGLITAY